MKEGACMCIDGQWLCNQAPVPFLEGVPSSTRHCHLCCYHAGRGWIFRKQVACIDQARYCIVWTVANDTLVVLVWIYCLIKLGKLFPCSSCTIRNLHTTKILVNSKVESTKSLVQSNHWDNASGSGNAVLIMTWENNLMFWQTDVNSFLTCIYRLSCAAASQTRSCHVLENMQ